MPTFCPHCHKMVAEQPTCPNCGKAMAPAGEGAVERQLFLSLARYVLAWVLGIVAVGLLCIGALVLLLS